MVYSQNASSAARSPRWARAISVLTGILALALAAGYLFGGNDNGGDIGNEPIESTSQFTPNTGQVSPPRARQGSLLSADDPTWGPKDASVTVVEFSDFECPFCREAYPTVRAMMQTYGDRVLFQYRDFPISDIHPDAQKAAEAAQCAYAQAKFWEYHDRLFQNQEDLSREALTQHALQSNLDLGAFNRCLDGGTKAQEVAADFQDGVDAGVGGTPTFFINGVKYEGVLPEEEFMEILEGLLR